MSSLSSLSDQSPSTMIVPAEPPTADSNDFIHNYNLDENDCSSDYSSSTIQTPPYIGGYVAPEHWLVCKAVLVFHIQYCKRVVVWLVECHINRQSLQYSWPRRSFWLIPNIFCLLCQDKE
jgi:hypothetical protein